MIFIVAFKRNPCTVWGGFDLGYASHVENFQLLEYFEILEYIEVADYFFKILLVITLSSNVFFISPFSSVPHFLLRSHCWSLQQSGEVLPGLSSPGDLILSYSIFHLSFDDWSSHHHQYCWCWPQSGQLRGQRRAKEEWTNIDQEELGCGQNTQKTNKADKWNKQIDKIKANLVVEMDAQWTKCQSHLPLQRAHPLLQPTATVLQASNKLEDEMSESNECKIVSGWASQVATNAKGVCAQLAGITSEII